MARSPGAPWVVIKRPMRAPQGLLAAHADCQPVPAIRMAGWGPPPRQLHHTSSTTMVASVAMRAAVAAPARAALPARRRGALAVRAATALPAEVRTRSGAMHGSGRAMQAGRPTPSPLPATCRSRPSPPWATACL